MHLGGMMTCRECESVEDDFLNNDYKYSTLLYYVRVGEANVGLVSCRRHATRVVELIKRGLEAEKIDEKNAKLRTSATYGKEAQQ